MPFNPDKPTENKPGPDEGANDYNNSTELFMKNKVPESKQGYNPFLDDGNFDPDQKLLLPEIDDVIVIGPRGDGNSTDTTVPPSTHI